MLAQSSVLKRKEGSPPPSKAPPGPPAEGSKPNLPPPPAAAQRAAASGANTPPQKPTGDSANTPTPPSQNDVFYRRYHNWNTPVTEETLGTASSLEECEALCSADQTCFGTTYDGSVQTCAKVPAANFDPSKGLMGRYTPDDITASMKDRGLETAPMDCYGPFKPEAPGRVSVTQCPRSREQAISVYFENAKPLALFANMLSTNPYYEMFE